MGMPGRSPYQKSMGRSNIANEDKADFWPTPPEATVALMDREEFVGTVWECACGNGAMSKVINRWNNNIISSDLHYRDFGTGSINFLTDTPHTSINNIITNPPFSLANEFVYRALGLASHKVALLLPHNFLLGSQYRVMMMTDLITKPYKIYPFGYRVPFQLPGYDTPITNKLHAWVVWDVKKNKSGKYFDTIFAPPIPKPKRK